MKFFLVALALPFLLPAAEPVTERWTVILTDPPAARGVGATRAGLGKPRQVRAASPMHREVEQAIRARGVHISSSTTNLLNAVFVHATKDQAAALRTIPGVARVQPQRRYKAKMAKALDLISAPAAWTRVGGETNAGRGILIGVIDSGIDPKHPALQGSTLSAPSGFPKCQPADCGYTSNKVIVARSYIGSIALASDPVLSRPDDVSPRDHIGHGTAVAAVAAGARTSGPAASTGGVAPAAYLGNYKVFGTPGVNDDSDPGTFDEAVIHAIDDAFADGVDVAIVALGAPALWGVYDNGPLCGNSGLDFCDPLAAEVESAVQSGMLVVAAAGNDGGAGYWYPTYGSINTPAIAPSAIAVGATTNAHFFVSSVYTLGDAPAGIQAIDAQLSNGLKFKGPITANVVDVATLGDPGTACGALPSGSLTGAIALVQRGDCTFFDKVANSERAGAIAVIAFQLDGYDGLFPMDGLATTGIPAVLISNTAGRALQSYMASTTNVRVTIDPALIEGKPDASYQDKVAYFTSWGPTLVDNLLKPEVVAPGTDLYIASQNYDPNGALYDPTRFYAANGTSFSAAMVAGAAALVWQNHPTLTTGQVKSAVVNTASAGIQDYDANSQVYPAKMLATGAGKLNVAAAVATTVSVEPATVSFGVLNTALPSQPLTLTNFGSTTVTLRLAVQINTPDSRARVSVPTSVILLAGQSTQVQAVLEGSFPAAGNYDGVISITGGAVPLRVPYFYIVGDGVPFNAYSLGGDQFVLSAETSGVRLSLKSTDQFGAPSVNQDVLFQPLVDGPTVDLATPTTDTTGIAEASVTLGPTLGYQGFQGLVNNIALTYFEGRARLGPQINVGGVVNAASNLADASVAPGSLITINGAGLADGSRTFDTPYLPWSLAGASVSFYSAAAGTSFAGRLVRVSDTAIIVQVPWELAGLASCTMKVSFGYFAQTEGYTLTLADAAPAVFELSDPAAGGTVAFAWDNAGSYVNSSNPVQRGSQLTILANGLGPVAGTPPSTGEAISNPPPAVAALPSILIGGQPGDVVSATLWASAPGYYLVTVTVPDSADTGRQGIVVKSGGATAKVVTTFLK